MPTTALSLPAELICVVFLHLVPHFPCVKYPRHPHLQLGWVASTTHVCRKWRYAALNFPELWAHNLCALPSSAATDCFLERAQTMPLVFRATQVDPGQAAYMTDHQITLALRNIGRVKAFDQILRGEYGPDPLSFTFIKSLEESTLPHLTFLRFHRWNSTVLGKFVIDHILDAPALRELHLDSIFFARTNTPQLRIFVATNDHEDYSTALDGVPRPVILEALKSMPLLEQLTLGGISELGHEDFNDGPGAVQVELPHLRNLRLKGLYTEFGFYFNVRAADTASVEIEYEECDDYRTLQTTFAVLEHHLRLSAYDMLTVHELGAADFTVHLCSSSALTQATAEEKVEPQFIFKASMDWEAPSVMNATKVIDILVPRIDVKKIKFLDISTIALSDVSEDDVNTKTVRNTLASFVSVTTVQLSAEDHKFLVAALRGVDVDGGDVEPPLPALQHLIAKNLSLWTRSLDAYEKSWSFIVDTLQERKDAGRPLRFLTLADRFKKFSGFHGDELLALEACDARWKLRAEKLVGKVFDWRHAPSPGSGRLVEYIRDL